VTDGRAGSHTSNRAGIGRRPAVVVILSVLGAVALAGCSSSEEPSPSVEPFVPDATATVTVYHLDTSVWYAGLVMHFGTATASLDPRGGPVSVATKIENPGSDAVTPSSQIRLTVPAAGFDLTHETVLPEIAAGASADVTLSFLVEGRGSLDDAVIRIGKSDDHQAIVPFGTGPLKAVTLEPRQADAKGTANAADLRLSLRSVVVREDLPDWWLELPHTSRALIVTYDVTYLGSFSGGVAFTGDNIALKLPNGTTLSPRHDGRSQSVVLVGPGKTITRLFSRFEIPATVSGSVTLILKNGSASGTVKVSLPA
jgi:hypothetical protein